MIFLKDFILLIVLEFDVIILREIVDIMKLLDDVIILNFVDIMKLLDDI